MVTHSAMATACIISSEMFFAMRIASAAKTLGVPLVILRSAAEVPTKLAADCPLAMIDLGSSAAANLLDLVAAIQAVAPQARIVAFGPHVDHELLERAQAAGCVTMSNGEFNQRYVNLLKEILSSD
jgi:DNA-binding NarL/FixJ family response regulator